MAKVHHRVFALVAALLFLASTIAVSAAVVWQIIKEPNTDSSKTDDATMSQQSPPTQNKLEGTKLTGFTPINTVKKLQIIDIKVGTGEVVKAGAKITAHYTGAIARDGTIFQSSHDSGQPFQSELKAGPGGVIEGWIMGIPGMKVGGKRRLIIPAVQAYGSQSPAPNIPPNSDLVFDIELIAVEG